MSVMGLKLQLGMVTWEEFKEWYENGRKNESKSADNSTRKGL